MIDEIEFVILCITILQIAHFIISAHIDIEIDIGDIEFNKSYVLYSIFFSSYFNLNISTYFRGNGGTPGRPYK